MMTLAVTGASGHRGPVFLAGPDGQRGPTALTCFFVGFRTDFVTYVRVCDLCDVCEGFGCFRRSFGPNGPSAREVPKTPKKGTPLPAPLATYLAAKQLCQLS